MGNNRNVRFFKPLFVLTLLSIGSCSDLPNLYADEIQLLSLQEKSKYTEKDINNAIVELRNRVDLLEALLKARRASVHTSACAKPQTRLLKDIFAMPIEKAK